MAQQSAYLPAPGNTAAGAQRSRNRWFVCGFLFLATTINYMDRSVFSLVEPLLHLDFMGWIPGVSAAHQAAYDIQYGRVLISFQIAYGVGFLIAGRIIDKVGTKVGYALAIVIWGCASISTSLVSSVMGFCMARIFLGLGESGNFPAALKATTEWFPPEERALATGLFNSGSNVASFFAPVLIVAVTSRFGWHAAFISTGAMGLIWAIVWIIFPYDKLRRLPARSSDNPNHGKTADPIYSILLRHRGFYAFFIAKGLTDPVFWFYLFYLPKFLNDNYGMNLSQIKYPLIVIYTAASFGSIAGGWISGFRMKQGHSVNSSRKFALFLCAICVTPIMLVPHMHTLFPANGWPAIALFGLAAAAHQGWSANLFSTPTDMFPSASVSTVVSLGGAAGAGGGAIFTWLVSHLFSLHPMLIFTMAGFAYIAAFLIFRILVPHTYKVGTPGPNRSNSGAAQ